MIIEPIRVEDEFFHLSERIVAAMDKRSLLDHPKLIVGVCGESGSGKTVTAVCLQKQLEKNKIRSQILHMDCYYLYPPSDNHNKRKADINWVGVNELNLELIGTHIDLFKSGVEKMTVPVVDYKANRFFDHEMETGNIDVLIIEGVYSFYVDALDYKIFLERNYLDTKEIRKSRSREVYDDFVERVLEIEHKLVMDKKHRADLIIDTHFEIKD